MLINVLIQYGLHAWLQKSGFLTAEKVDNLRARESERVRDGKTVNYSQLLCSFSSNCGRLTLGRRGRRRRKMWRRRRRRRRRRVNNCSKSRSGVRQANHKTQRNGLTEASQVLFCNRMSITKRKTMRIPFSSLILSLADPIKRNSSVFPSF